VPEFVNFALNSPSTRHRTSSIIHGVGRPRLNLSEVRAICLPLAPLNEQRRIVAKIEELFSDLDAGVAALERIRVNLKRYRAAVLKAAVEGKLTAEWRAKHPKTEPASKLLERILAERRQKWEQDQLAKFAAAGKTPPKGWREKYVEPAAPDTSGLPEPPQGWCWASLDQSCRKTTDGEHLSPNTRDTGVMLLSAKDVRDHGVVIDDPKYVSFEDAVKFRERCNPELDDVLIVSRGATIGRTAVVQIDTPFCLMGSVILLKSVGSNVVAKMLAHWLKEMRCQRSLLAASGSTAQQAIYIRDIRTLAIPLPPLDEQSQLVSRIEEQFSIIAFAEQETETVLRRAARLRQSILKRAFEGKLVPQDPTDEPAEKLLERIRASRSNKGNGNDGSPARTRRKPQR
jgi:type I restriction enzyme S subunit